MKKFFEIAMFVAVSLVLSTGMLGGMAWVTSQSSIAGKQFAAAMLPTAKTTPCSKMSLEDLVNATNSQQVEIVNTCAPIVLAALKF